ncbi:MAG: RsmB/NOP family class I SAM-dependent RNA methyltransferase [Bradymonadaceae bacterium]|nr:RsmB/NOP family class I SAM-dependent RNA methyltransferase [Lujinxingiaceae bacterium]
MSFETLERYRPFIDDWDGFVAALSRPLPICVWTNTLKSTPEQLAQWMAEGGYPIDPVSWYARAFKLPSNASPGNRIEYVAGLYHVQEEASLLPVVLLDPQPHERIFDMCAAPGNKTAQIAVHMQNTGTVLANDRDFRRVRAIGHALERLGLHNTTTTTFDAANFPRESGPFDRILADVPCSCEGTSRKNPEVLDPTRGIGLASGLQKAILKKAVQLCRPGGRIVYSTCTYAPEENEMVVNDALGEAGHNMLRMIPAQIPGFKSAPGLLEWQGQSFDPQMKQAMRVYPHHNDTGGFFVAVLEKGPFT